MTGYSGRDLDGLRKTASEIIFDGGDILITVGLSRRGLGVRADYILSDGKWRCIATLVADLRQTEPEAMESLLLQEAPELADIWSRGRQALAAWIRENVRAPG